MSEDPITNCTTCDATVQRVFHPVAVHFKGSGFYTTDYGSKKRSAASSSSESSSSDSGSSKKDDSKKSDSGSSSSSD
jgi:predicted nucleic acid-binding Zn ribbon protein